METSVFRELLKTLSVMLNLFQHLLKTRRLRVILNQVQDAMTRV